MSGDLELSVRRAVRQGASRVGTPPASLGLLALAAIYLLAWAAMARLRSPEAAAALGTSWAYDLLAVALVLDAAVMALRRLPLEIMPEGKLRLVVVRATVARLLVATGYLVVALAFTASLLSRDRFELRVAEGEEFTGAREQFVGRDPPRRMSPGPFTGQFTPEQVGVRFDRAGVVEGPVATLRFTGGRGARVGPRDPVWRGWGRFLTADDAGITLRYEIAAKGGGVLDSAFAKLDLFPAGKTDSIRSSVVPHRIYLELADEVPGAPPAAPALHAAIYRGKLLVAEGEIAPGGELEFEGLVVRFPEARAWVQLGMVRDTGIPLAVIGAVVAAVGWVLGLRRMAQEPSPLVGSAGA